MDLKHQTTLIGSKTKIGENASLYDRMRVGASANSSKAMLFVHTEYTGADALIRHLQLKFGKNIASID